MIDEPPLSAPALDMQTTRLDFTRSMDANKGLNDAVEDPSASGLSIPENFTANSGATQSQVHVASFEKVKKDLEGLLNDGLKFGGTFACFERYPATGAPNPFLRLDELGVIGIPLSAREANVILSSRAAAVTHKWELPATQVQIDNPEWQSWIQEKAGPAAAKSLAGSAFAKPTYNFKKLILQEPGSQFTCFPPTDSSERDTNQDEIGTLVVLLPSIFDGGQLQLRHADDTLLVDLSDQSGISTSVIAAYSGVASELGHMTSGYRFSMVYDILQPITHPDARRSGLPDMERINKRLKQTLNSWMEDRTDAESRTIHCLLKEKYERAPSFGRRCLAGADAHLVTHLGPLAQELGFHLHFAHVELVITASDTVEEEEYYDGYGENPYDKLGPDDFNFNMEDVEDGELSVIQVIDLEGMPLIAPGVNFLATDVINGYLTDDDPDLSEFEREDERTASCTNTYRRVVLLISKSDPEFSPNINEIYDYASIALRDSCSLTPSNREMTLVDGLLQLSETTCDAEQLRTIAHLLTQAADRWNNLPILLRTVKACRVDRNIDLLGVDMLISMYQAFGWDALKDFYGDALKNDETNLARQAFLTGLLEMAKEEGSAEVIAWCETQQEQLLGNLRAFDLSQIEWLIEVATARGGDFVTDVIFPQLKLHPLETPFWIALMKQLRNITTWSPQLSDALILFCLDQAVEALPAFPTVTKSRLETDTDGIMAVIRICAETGNSHLCDRISARMHEAARTATFSWRLPAWRYYSRLAVSLNEYLDSGRIEVTPAAFSPFFSDAVDSMLGAGQDAKFEDCSLSTPNLKVINMALSRAGGISFLKKRLKTDYWKPRTSADLQAFVRSIRADFTPPADDVAATSEFLGVTSALVDTAIHALDISTLVPRKPVVSYSVLLQYFADFVKFCLQVDAPKCQDLLVKLLEPPAGFTISQHVDKLLVPFIPVLKTFLATVHLDYRTEPFRMFSVAVIKAYANTVVGKKPHELVVAAELEGVGCSSCPECAELRAFFTGDSPSIEFSRAQAKRSHLEQHLGATTPWGVTWETHKLRSPHALRITKPPRMIAVDLATNTQKGMSLLTQLGDSGMRRQILGADHDWILAKITPPKKPNLPSTSQKRSGTQPAGGQAKKKARTS